MSDVLVVVSKIMKSVKANHDLRTSEEAIQALSTMVEEALRTGAENARRDGRKTIAARDLVVGSSDVPETFLTPGEFSVTDVASSL